MKLHYSPFSSNARKVRITAGLLGIELELEPVDLMKGAQRNPEFLAINPMGKVPVLVDGDFVLSESAAIMAYLADGKPGHALYPDDCRRRHRMLADECRARAWKATEPAGRVP